jgi:beta-mannanase
VGLYLPDNIHSATEGAFQYTQLLGERVQILSFYVAWGSGRRNLDISGFQEVLRRGYIPMITWEPWQWPQEDARPEDQPDYSLSEILKGKYDDYIRSWARDLKQISGPIFFRPMHEMNGNWYPWCGGVSGNQPEEYIEAWCYIRSIFNEARNDQLMWVWSPYAHSVPSEPGNELRRYYPGTKEVDWLALDGYNWGNTQTWSNWLGFKEIFEEAYEQLASLAPEKPMMIAEVGCAEEGGNKGDWIEEAFQILKDKFSKINALIWFNTKKECNWRIESSPQSLKAFRKSVKNWTFMASSKKPGALH